MGAKKNPHTISPKWKRILHQNKLFIIWIKFGINQPHKYVILFSNNHLNKINQPYLTANC